MLKISAFYIDKQKSFIPKKIWCVPSLQDSSFWNQQMLPYCVATLHSIYGTVEKYCPGFLLRREQITLTSFFFLRVLHLLWAPNMKILNTNYGRPMKPFFIKIPNFWAWTDNLGRYILGHLGYFRLIYQHPFFYCQFLVHVFH